MADETPKGPKITFLGTRGVYLDQNPITMPDGSWRRLLNGEFAITGARTRGRAMGGIRKRGGLAPWSADLGTNVLACAGVPLASEMDFSARLVLACNSGEAEAWKTSVDGAVFTDLATTVLPRCYQNRAWTGVNFDQERPPRAANYRRNLYYPSNDYTEANPPNDPPPIAVYAGSGTGYNVVDIGKYGGGTNFPFAITDTLYANGLIYLSLWESSGFARVMSLEPRTGALTQIGNVFTPASGSAMCLAWYQNKLWVGTYALIGTAQGYIYSIRPDEDATWTLDHTSSVNNGGYHQLVTYGTALYALTDADVLDTAIIEQRTAAGVWSTSFTAPTAGASRFAGAIEFEGNLYCGWYRDVATTGSLIVKYNGTVWSTDKDVKVDYALKVPGQPVVFNDELYWPVMDYNTSTAVDNFLMKRTAAGVWSRPLTGVGLQGTAALYYPTPTV